MIRAFRCFDLAQLELAVMKTIVGKFADLTAPGETTVARHRFAIALITISSIGFSFGGLLVRSMQDATVWQINLYRSFFIICVLLGMLFAQYGSRIGEAFWRIGPLGLLASVMIGFGPVFYLLGMTNTTVANTLFIIATVPFITSVLAWLLLGERVRTGTWLAMSVALFGILMMVGEGIALGAVFGNAMAFSCALVFSIFAVITRRERSIDMLPTLVVGAVLTGAISLVASWPELYLGSSDVLLCFIWGGIVSGLLGNWLFIKAIRHLAAAEITLLMMTEFVLGPLWVLFFIGEVPGRFTILGGILVLGAVGARAAWDLRRSV
jgi:drug/metabolite transporter (DMT)-like permease